MLRLAYGYNQLYQGQSATGANLGVPATVTNVYNGNLSTVEGVSAEPGSATASTPYLPAGTSPRFPSPHIGLVHATLYNFTARVTGAVVFNQTPTVLEHLLGKSNSIRADMGETITIGSIGTTGRGVTINSPGGAVTIGQNFVTGSNATILGGSNGTKVTIGDNVAIGQGAVVVGTSLGSGSTVGNRAYLVNSTFPAGTQVASGAIYENNKLIGFVAW